MIYNQREGFDQDLSMIDYLKSNGAIGGNGKAFYVQGMDDFKFRMSNVKEKMAESQEFRDHVYKTARALMQSSISESSKIHVVDTQEQDVILLEDSTDIVDTVEVTENDNI